MKKSFIKVFLALSVLCSFVNAQEGTSIILRDKDMSKFQKVKLYLNVLDKDGKPVTNIDSTSITITENETGKQVNPKVENFYASTEPMAILFTIDASNSMDGPPLNNVKEGMLKIISEFRNDDKMGIAYFHDDFFKQASFDTDRDVLRNNISSLKTGGSSSEIYKSVIESIKWLKSLPEPKRKILVIISDGEDNGTQYRLEDVMNEVKNSGLTVFTIGSTAENKGFLKNMESISGSSPDGKYYKISGPEDIKNIIPTLYDRIKQEYVVSYFSYAEPSSEISASINLKLRETAYKTDFNYKSPASIVEHAPSISFWSTKEFLFSSIGAGVLIAVLAVFMFINISKKKQFKREKEEERQLREAENADNEERFNRFKNEYESLLDRIENQQTVSESDKEMISRLEQQLEETGRSFTGAAPSIDFKRRTMILEKGNSMQNYHVSEHGKGGWLIIRSGPASGNEFLLGTGSVTIGRKDANLILKDDTVSRHHARVFFNGGSFVIEDMGSTNGTFVNGSRISNCVLKSNDRIRIGSVELTFIQK
ncbi:MAG: FHA domain-containing protein [Ignavibacteria bacterium]|nr:FHA domain-containing protein [Ignavibacteria bacterium]